MSEQDLTPKKQPARVWRPAFLAALAETANVRAACRAAGISRTWAYMDRERYPTFRKQWDDALAEACDVLEAVARQRALSGESDTLLIFLLKSHRPEVYREARSVDVTTGGLPLTLAELMLAATEDEDDAAAPPARTGAARNGHART